MDGAIPAGGRRITRPLAPPGETRGALSAAPGTSRRRVADEPPASSADKSTETDVLLRMTGAAVFAVGMPSARAGMAPANTAASAQRLDVRSSLPLPVAFLMRFTFGPYTYYDGPRLRARWPKPLKSLRFGLFPGFKTTTAVQGETTDSGRGRPVRQI